jgi:hypothetical protein
MFYVVPDNLAWFHTQTGSVTMTVVPEPGSLALLAMIFASQRRSRHENKMKQARRVGIAHLMNWRAW